MAFEHAVDIWIVLSLWNVPGCPCKCLPSRPPCIDCCKEYPSVGVAWSSLLHVEQLVSGWILEVKVKLSWNLKGNRSKFFLHIGWTWRDGDRPGSGGGCGCDAGILEGREHGGVPVHDHGRCQAKRGRQESTSISKGPSCCCFTLGAGFCFPLCGVCVPGTFGISTLASLDLVKIIIMK